MYSGGSIGIRSVDLEVSYDVLSPLPIVLSKHFNHPHPYIEIATAISDIMACCKKVCACHVSQQKSIDVHLLGSSGMHNVSIYKRQGMLEHASLA